MTLAEVRDTQPHDPELACPICKKLIWEAVKTPCCSTSFCEECIQGHLLEHEFVCESCESKLGSLEELVADEELRERVGKYVEGVIERSKRAKAEEDEAAGITPGQGEGEGLAGEEKRDSEEKDGDKPKVSLYGTNLDCSRTTHTDQIQGTDGENANAESKEKTDSNVTANGILDPAKMQEMMNPQTMQLYLSQVRPSSPGQIYLPFITPPSSK